jgi:diguanylate cyclase (GGDEF)-like protein
MISLKKSLSQIEELSDRLAAALGLLAGAIGSIEQHAVEVNEADAAEHRQSLRRIRKSVEESQSREALEQCGLDLENELRRYARRAAVFLKDRQREIREILEILAQAAQTITTRSDDYSTQFGKLAHDLESVAALDDLTFIRKRLADSVSRLRACVESMQRDEMASVARLQGELQTFRRRLQEAETMAATDPLTGLANRREAEALMARKIKSGRAFCIMLFDLDGFKGVNDRYGHNVGDHLLQAFAKRLQGQFRSDDAVCRWGGDEFLVVLSAPLPDATERAHAVASRMGGLYAVQTARGAVNIYVSASVGLAQYEPGESGEQLFARADACLYQDKRERRGALGMFNSALESAVPKA